MYNSLIRMKVSLQRNTQLLTLATNTITFHSLILYLSPSNRMLAILPDHNTCNSNITIYNMQTNTTKIITNASASQLYFSNDDKTVLLNCRDAIRKYNLVQQSWGNDLYHASNTTSIGYMYKSAFSQKVMLLQNYKLLQIDTITLKQRIHKIHSVECNAETMVYDASLDTLVTSSYDCTICVFAKNETEFMLLNRVKLSECRIKHLYLKQSQIIVTQDTLLSKYPSLIALDRDSLKVLTKKQQYSATIPSNVAFYQNYIISYGQADTQIFIYQDTLEMLGGVVDFTTQQIISTQYDYKTKQLIIALLDPIKQTTSIHNYQITFNCSTTNSSNNNTLFSPQCSCPKGQIFQKSTAVCKQQKCQTVEGKCVCEGNMQFNKFTTQCQINCSKIFGTSLNSSYGTEQCACKQPLSWNRNISDCSLVDCSYIPFALDSSIKDDCACKQGYRWNQTYLNCTIIPQQKPVISNSQFSIWIIVFAMFAAFILAILAIVWYVKKCKKSPEDEPKPYMTFQQRKEVELATHRPLDKLPSSQNQLAEAQKQQRSKLKKENRSIKRPERRYKQI